MPTNAVHFEREHIDEDGQLVQSGWYFWDETWAYQYGPFASEEEAQAKLEEYMRTLLGSHPVKHAL